MVLVLEAIGKACHALVALAERIETVLLFKGLHHGERIVGRVLHASAPRVRRDDHGRRASSRAPGIALRRRHVVPAAAGIVVQDDDCRVRPQGAVLHGMHDIGGPLLAGQNGRIARMLVELAGELDERDLRQLAGRQVDVELRLVLQFRRGADVPGIQSPSSWKGAYFAK